MIISKKMSAAPYRLIRKFICIHDKRSSILVRFRQRSDQKTALKSFSRVLVVDGVNG